MRIALLTNGIYPYVMGGMEKHSYYLAKYLAANEIFVDLYHFIPKNSGGLPLPFSENELKFIKVINILYPPSLKFPGHYLFSNYKYSKYIFDEFIKNEKVDFIYAKGFSGWYFLDHLKKLYPTTPLATNFHGYEMFQKWPSIKVGIKLQILKSPVRVHLVKSDYVFSYGSKITELLIAQNVPLSKIIEIPTGIDSNWLNKNISINNEFNIVFIGRYERRKGIEEINIALKELIKKPENNFRFHFVGPIPEKKKIADSRVIYHGPIIEQEKISEFLKTCDLLVCPSHSEGMPNVILEGMASGCAVIASNVGAVSLMIDDSNGWTIEPGNVNQLLNTLNEARNLSKEKLLMKRQSSIQKVEQNFLWSLIAKRHIEKISSLIV